MGTNNSAHLEAGINITTTRIQMYLDTRRYPIRSQKLLQENWCVGFNIAVTKNRRLVTAEQFRTIKETLLYRGGVVSSFFITVRSLSYSYRTPSREVLASLRGRRWGRHMMGSEGEAEQSETRPAEAEPCFPANSPRPSSPRGVRLRRSGTQDSYVMSLRCQPPCASGIPSRPPTCGA